MSKLGHHVLDLTIQSSLYRIEFISLFYHPFPGSLMSKLGHHVLDLHLRNLIIFVEMEEMENLVSSLGSEIM